jgi:hypothetical protein
MLLPAWEKTMWKSKHVPLWTTWKARHAHPTFIQEKTVNGNSWGIVCLGRGLEPSPTAQNDKPLFSTASVRHNA